MHARRQASDDGGGGPAWRRHLVTLGLLALVALLLRFPFFFPAVLDWDESTFVLMGQSILDGHLPYVHLWDFKPPLAFPFYALAIAILGRDLVGIRVAGAACVAVAAFLVYLIGTRLWTRKAGLLAAMLAVLVTGLLRSGQATMTEHIALLPVLAALYLLLSTEASGRTLFVAGILLSTATLVRINFAYVVIVVGLYILSSSIRRSVQASVSLLAAYAAGGIVVVGLTWLPYALTGQQAIWWNSTFLAPLRYSSAHHSVLRSLAEMAQLAIYLRWKPTGYRFPPVVLLGTVNALLWLGALGGLATLPWQWHGLRDAERRGITLLLLFALGTCAGVLIGGSTFEHYLIQMVPFAALLCAALIQRLPLRQLPRSLRWASAVVAGVVIVMSMAPILAEYQVVASRARRHQNLRHGGAYEIVAYLRRENASGAPVCLLTDHIAYWFLGSYPLTKLATHPANLSTSLVQAAFGKDDSAEAELRALFRTHPEFVVASPDYLTDQVTTALPHPASGAVVWFLSGNPETLLERIIADQYLLVADIKGRHIYRRRPATPTSSSYVPRS